MRPWHQVIGELLFTSLWYEPDPHLRLAYRRGWVEGFFSMWPFGILAVVVIFFFWSLSL